MIIGRTTLLHSTRLSLLVALALLGCGETATAPDNKHVSPTDIRFITGLYNIKEFDNRVIGDELHRQSDPRVVALAEKIQAHVNTFYAKVEPVAQRDGISPPATVTLAQQSDMQARIAALMGKGKYDFDLEFLDDEIAAHHDMLDRARDVLQQPVGDPELRTLLQEGETTLQSNLTELKALRSVIQSEGR